MMCSGKIELGFPLMGSVLDTAGVSAPARGAMCTIKRSDPPCPGLPHAAIWVVAAVCRVFLVCFISLLMWSPWLPRCPGLSSGASYLL